MKPAIFILFFFPLQLFSQPFKVNECRLRNVEVNDYKYFDIHIILNSKKSSNAYSIDSITFNNSGGIVPKLSVLGKNISDTCFEKKEKILLQFTVPYINMSAERDIKVFYHYKNKNKRTKPVLINKLKYLDEIKFQHNQ